MWFKKQISNRRYISFYAASIFAYFYYLTKFIVKLKYAQELSMGIFFIYICPKRSCTAKATITTSKEIKKP